MDWRDLSYPVRGPRGETTLVTGLVWVFVAATTLDWFPSLLSLAAVPSLVVLAGYLVTVQYSGLRGADDPPRFAGYVSLVRRGLASVALSVAYLLVPAILLVVTVRGTQVASDSSLGFQSSMSLLFGSTAVLVTALAAAFLLPVGVVRSVRTNRLVAGLHLDAVRRRAVRSTYLVAWTVGATVVTALVAVVGPVWGTNRPVAVLVLGVGYYALVLTAYGLGRSLSQPGAAESSLDRE